MTRPDISIRYAEVVRKVAVDAHVTVPPGLAHNIMFTQPVFAEIARLLENSGEPHTFLHGGPRIRIAWLHDSDAARARAGDDGARRAVVRPQSHIEQQHASATSALCVLTALTALSVHAARWIYDEPFWNDTGEMIL